MGRRKHDCYFEDYDYIGPCSQCPESEGCRDYVNEWNSVYGGGHARYVWKGCPNCSCWDDYYGCQNGYEPGDRCTDADLW